MRRSLTNLLYCIPILTVISCKTKTEINNQPAESTANVSTTMQQQPFGNLEGGEEVNEYILTNKNGVEIKVINYGGIITSIKVPDKNGIIEDVVLGYDSLDGYLRNNPFFGSLVGRYGNRIANGKFKLDGKEYALAQNNNGQHLHGGIKGFDKVFWNIAETGSEEGHALRLTYESKDMEEGYPGNLSVEVIYVLTDNDELKINYSAKTDKKTIVNLTQHTYFNLTGNVTRDILDHELMLKADHFLPVNKSLIPTGEMRPVKETPFDFNLPMAIGTRIDHKDQQLEFGQGYDHCWVLSSNDSLKMAASVYEPLSGRYMEVYTTEPGVQFYTGNFLNGSITGKGNVIYKRRFGLCLETEHFPDSPNQPSFPSVILNPGEVYKTQTIYRFSTR